uniref:Uncharacterized protein n=1 Tax=Entomoneis paludosa TaxID=265537 RepID=A0A7S2V9E6_9STRA|mmetsp:Transcript_12326/g.25559  ORF Transcript_12326/g.25559 Transcript_12326/m.25559 type:complete len:738 (+) Transcript_12326:151-2364(+)
MSRRILLPSFVGILVVTFFTVYNTPRVLRELEHQDDRFALRLPPLAHRLADKVSSGNSKRNRKQQIHRLAQVSVSAIGQKDRDVGKWTNAHNVVHVIHTRFMQHQSGLVNLGNARMDLFKTFTLPSIRQQTNQEFLWIVWTDSSIRGKVRYEMLEAASSIPNVVVLGAEQQQDTDFRHLNGLEKDQLVEVYITGNQQMLMDYHEAAKTRLLVETNLDADDAFSKNFVESVQSQAVDTIGQSKNEKQLEVLCPERHLEWRYYKPDDEEHWKGHLIQFHNKDVCINSGLSIGYHVQASAVQLKGVMNQEHQVLQNQMEACGTNESQDKTQKHERRITPCNGQGTRKFTYVKEQEGPEHLDKCPQDSFPCESHSHSSLGGPTFMIPSQTITCHVEGSFGDHTVDVEVTPSKYSPGTTKQSKFSLDVLSGDYMLAAVHLKSNIGASLYTWSTESGETGGTRYGTFSTPKERALHHLDICVIPRDNVCSKEDSVEARMSQRPASTTKRSKPTVDDGEDEALSNECQRPLQLLNQDTLAPTRNYFQTGVLMARTPTASGMKNVVPETSTASKGKGTKNSIPEDAFESSEAQGHAWIILEHDFGVDLEEVSFLRANFEENMEQILTDAVVGQCQHRFSCHDSSTHALKSLLQKVKRRKLTPGGVASAGNNGEQKKSGSTVTHTTKNDELKIKTPESRAAASVSTKDKERSTKLEMKNRPPGQVPVPSTKKKETEKKTRSVTQMD